MTTKNMLGGALINYGQDLPNLDSSPDGALFFKTSGGSEGLYIYRLISDSNSALLGNQTAAGWSLISAFGTGINADTLDGLDSSAFQPVSSELTALSGLSSTGIIIRTGSGAYSAKSVAAGSSKISITNGAGTSSGNIQIDVVENQLTLSNIGGSVPASKGGTGLTSFTPGAVAFGSTSTQLGLTSVGTAATGSGTSRVWQVLTSGGSSTPQWTDSSSLNVAYATSAASANTASSVSAEDGVASAPSISFQNDSSIGLWLFRDTSATPGPNELRAAVGGQSRLRISPTEIIAANGAVFSGNGSLLTNLNAGALASGTVPNARISGEYTGFTNLGMSGALSLGSSITFNEVAGLIKNDTVTDIAGVPTVGTGRIGIAGGNDLNVGASIMVFGPNHSTAPSLGRLRTDTATILEWSSTKIDAKRDLNVTGNLTVSGTINATLDLSNLNASNLTSGTVPNARISGEYTGLTDITMSGSLTIGGSIICNIDSNNTVVSGGTTTTSGASMIVYGPASTPASLGRLRVGTETIVQWDANEVDVNKDLVVTGNLRTTDSAVISRVIRLESSATTGSPANLIIQGSTVASDPNGGQITFGYGDGLGGVAAGSQPNTWAIDIAGTEPTYPNTFRIFRVNAAGIDIAPVKIREASGGMRLLSLGVGTEPSGVTGEIRASGTITQNFSDRRLKTNVEPITNALEKLRTLSGVTYVPNDLAVSFGYSQLERSVGLFADEVEGVLPEAVKPAPFDTNEKNESLSGENYKTVQYEKLIPLLVEAIKQQQEQIDELMRRIDGAQ